jgi:hypothetical protein
MGGHLINEITKFQHGSNGCDIEIVLFYIFETDDFDNLSLDQQQAVRLLVHASLIMYDLFV